MPQSTQGIPGLPDLTHPTLLIKLGGQLIQLFPTLILLIVALGIAIAVLNFSLRRFESDRSPFVEEWVPRYSRLLNLLQHTVLVFILLLGGFYVSSTLSNRYHHWEQARVATITNMVSGERLEQPAPQIRYLIQEPYSYDTMVNGKYTRVESKREATRYLTLGASQAQVKIDQLPDPQRKGRTIYRVDFKGEYRVTNSLSNIQQFFFEVPPPSGYSLLQSFRVERDGTRLEQRNPGDYGFPFQLAPGQEAQFSVTYQAVGSPRWVYNANGQLLSNFRLTALANFPGADFASGIIPTEQKQEGQGTRFTWVFNDNVSVANPFGVFTAVGPISNTGILPRLLLLAPGLWLWWLLLLYLSLPMSLKNVAITAAVFFACLLALTYFSRVIDAKVAWLMISGVFLVLVWGLGQSRASSLAAVICAIAGAILPVFALLLPSTGLSLSVAALLSALWLAVRNWYGYEVLKSGSLQKRVGA